MFLVKYWRYFYVRWEYGFVGREGRFDLCIEIKKRRIMGIERKKWVLFVVGIII